MPDTEKSILPVVIILTGIFAVTVIADVIMTTWAVKNGFTETNPVAAPFVNNNPLLWVAIRLFGAGVVCTALIKLGMYQSTITKTSSLAISALISGIGVMQFAQNLSAMGVV